MIRLDTCYKTLVLYASSVSLLDYIKPSVYTAFLNVSAVPFFMIKEFRKTIWIDLEKTEDDILMGFRSNTRNEVRKAIREGFTIERVTSAESFVDYYNAFAKEKGLGEISSGKLLKYPKVFMYKAMYNGKPFTMHASIADDDNKIVRLLYSASIRFDSGVDRKYVGLSNRLLHYVELLEFKNLGFKIYDFGGINEDETNKEQYNITLFKKGFGGDVKDEIHLRSVLAWILLKVSIMLSLKSAH